MYLCVLCMFCMCVRARVCMCVWCACACACAYAYACACACAFVCYVQVDRLTCMGERVVALSSKLVDKYGGRAGKGGIAGTGLEVVCMCACVCVCV
jgi:hypothetical protein